MTRRLKIKRPALSSKDVDADSFKRGYGVAWREAEVHFDNLSRAKEMEWQKRIDDARRKSEAQVAMQVAIQADTIEKLLKQTRKLLDEVNWWKDHATLATMPGRPISNLDLMEESDAETNSEEETG